MRPATLGVTPGVDTLVRGAATREKVPRVPLFPLLEGQLPTLPQPLLAVLVGAASNYSGQSRVVPVPAAKLEAVVAQMVLVALQLPRLRFR